MKKVYIVGGKRTAIGKFLGSLSTVKPGDLAAQVMRQVIEDAALDASKLDEVLVAHQHSAGQGPSIGRRAQLEAGIPVEVPAATINMQCGSGMKAVVLAYNSIQAGSDIVLVGAVESMSQVPFILTDRARKGVRMGNGAIDVQDSLFCDGLIDQFNGYLMGVTAENVAQKIGISREDQDKFAVISQNRAQKAVEGGRFAEEIVPVHYRGKKGVELIFDTDESYMPDACLASFEKLRPSFLKENGTVTAGNACQLSDGAAALLIASEDAVRENGWESMAEIISMATVGIDPAIMGLGPVNAIKKALTNAKLDLRNIELMELNEAFAAQALGCIRELGEEYGMTEAEIMQKTNVNGGAIALGHPVAASGARILVSLLYELKKQNLTYGLASLCVGGGMGTAMLVKMCKM